MDENEMGYSVLNWLHEQGKVSDEDITIAVIALKEQTQGFYNEGSWLASEVEEAHYYLDQVELNLTGN